MLFQKKEEMKQLTWIITLILLLPIVLSAGPGSAPAPGGNITQLLIFAGPKTPNWQGYAGIITYGTGATAPTTVNATGSNVTGQGLHFQIPCNNPTAITGFVLFSNSSAAPAGLVPGNLTQLDAYVPGTENGTLTFTQTSTFNFPSAGAVNNVPTTNTYVNSMPQNTSFREGYLNDAAGNIIFATEINFVPPTGYNGSSFSYQIMVAAPNYSTVPYYIFTDLTAVCPKPAPSGGGGGSAGRCEERWDCTEWGPCIDGVQRRNCTQTVRCRYSSGYFPPTERTCGPKPIKPSKKENITIEEFPLEETLENITMTAPDRILLTALNTNTIEVMIQNDNKISLENMNLQLDIPETTTKYLPIHQFRPVLWSYTGLNGWSIRNRLQNKYPWKTKSEQFRTSPQSTTARKIEITPPPLLPQETETVLTLSLGNFEIKTKTIPAKIQVKEFDTGYSFNPKTNVFTLFFIVDNRGKPVMKNAFIEFNLNKGRKTTLAELYGPYNFPEDRVTILAQEYKLSKGLIGKEFEMKANINNGKYFNEVERKCIISG
jgi:hypothetical protein